MPTDYRTFLASKRRAARFEGFEPTLPIAPHLFPFQRDIVAWAIRKGRAAIFSDCGTGKTRMQLEWARHVWHWTGRDILILAPLSVAQQTKREGEDVGIEVHVCRRQSDVHAGINITNYEMLSHFDPSHFGGVVLDESSILKSFDGKQKKTIISAFQGTPYRLACTATPSPNDYVELGNHALFLGIVSSKEMEVVASNEMLTRWFVADGETVDSRKYRLKKHAEKDFWRWVSSWAVSLSKPSDIGYDDAGFVLPPLNIHEITVESDATPGMLFAMQAKGLNAQRAARRASLEDRVKACARIVDFSHGIEEPEQCHLPRRGESTCGPTLQPTENASENFSEQNIPNGTPSNASDTQLTRNSERSKKHCCEQQTKASGETGAFDPSTESAVPTSTPCSNDKAEGVQSAEPSLETASNEDSVSITITQQDSCGDCSAPTATKDSESSRTILNSCSGLLTTSTTVSPKNTSVRQDETWLIWCDLNDEQDALEKQFGDRCISIYGSLPLAEKETRLLAWLRGDKPILISKPSIVGWGVNMQCCCKVAFVGLSHSYEQFYQAVRRCWRFGQTKPVDVYVIASEAEGSVKENIQRKQADHDRMKAALVEAMAEVGLGHKTMELQPTQTAVETGRAFTLHLGDSCEVLKSLPAESVGLTITSPPFETMFIYSDMAADIGNSADGEEFFEHFRYMIPELLRITKPGRLCAVHCKDLAVTKGQSGHIGLRDFPGEIIRSFEEVGWVYHSRCTIWKSPVTEMQRTKAFGLLYKNLLIDSCQSRCGMADYMLVFRKWGGEFRDPVPHTREEFPLEQWQNWADPIWLTDESPRHTVWMDIDQGDVLNARIATEERDERHVCPLQLGVVARCLTMGSREGDLILDPFNGIGSTGVKAIEMGRQYVGVELKPAYWKQALKFLKQAEVARFDQRTLFEESA